MRSPIGLPVAVALAVLLVAVSACASTGDGTTAGSSSPTPPPSATPSTGGGAGGGTASPSPTGGTTPLPADLRTRPAVAAAIADLARRQGVDPAQVVIAAWQPVTWNDGSLGCPQEGMGYTQVQVDGQLLVLRVDTAMFQYHARGGGPFAYCANPSKGYTVGG
jgi:hypothetical protein